MRSDLFERRRELIEAGSDYLSHDREKQRNEGVDRPVLGV